jgi:hypothetical protein
MKAFPFRRRALAVAAAFTLIMGACAAVSPAKTDGEAADDPVQEPATASQIIADHTVVDRYASIPDEYIARVKSMWLDVPGESHSAGYRNGLALLNAASPRFAVGVAEGGTPEAPTTAHLRVSKATWGDVDSASGWVYGYGEEDWYTSDAAVARTKAHLDYCSAHGLTVAAFGFGWCWDMTWTNDPGGGLDPVSKVHWAGSSDGGPDGNRIWGLDAADEALTVNRVCMDTYLAATQAYIDHCAAKGYATKVFFTTGPIEGASEENAYQRFLKHQRIRDYVKADKSRILFDYADILSYNNAGQQATETWTNPNDGASCTFPTYHAGNGDDSENDGDHIGSAGALRLGKALWWMLARMAGWSG